MRSTAIIILAAISASATTIQRVSDREIADGVLNDIGEMTYTISDDGSAVVRIGTSDRDTVYVADPTALHISPRKELSPDEYLVNIPEGSYWDTNGWLCVYTDVTNRDSFIVSIVPLSAQTKLSSVSFSHTSSAGGTAIFVDRGNESCLDIRCDSGPLPGRPDTLYLHDIHVMAYTTSRCATWDAVTDPLTMRDTLGSVSIGGIREWVRHEYDGQTARYWSKHPAMHALDMAGYSIAANSAISLGGSAYEWSIAVNGRPALTVLNNGEGGVGNWGIVDTVIETNDTLSVYIDVACDGDPLVSISENAGRSWTPVAQTSSYPLTFVRGGRQCYCVSIDKRSLPGHCLLRAAVQTSGDDTILRASAPLQADGGIYLMRDGVRHAVEAETWTFVTTGGVTITRQVFVEATP